MGHHQAEHIYMCDYISDQISHSVVSDSLKPHIYIYIYIHTHTHTHTHTHIYVKKLTQRNNG